MVFLLTRPWFIGAGYKTTCVSQLFWLINICSFFVIPGDPRPFGGFTRGQEAEFGPEPQDKALLRRVSLQVSFKKLLRTFSPHFFPKPSVFYGNLHFLLPWNIARVRAGRWYTANIRNSLFRISLPLFFFFFFFFALHWIRFARLYSIKKIPLFFLLFRVPTHFVGTDSGGRVWSGPISIGSKRYEEKFPAAPHRITILGGQRNAIRFKWSTNSVSPLSSRWLVSK